MLRVNQVKVKPGHSHAELKRSIAGVLGIPGENITAFKIIRQSVDARKKPQIVYSYSVDVAVKGEDKILRRFRGKENIVSRGGQKPYRFPVPGKVVQDHPTVIVGTGPAGLFCGYFLALHGYRPILLERGKCVEERQKDVEAFWETGRLNPGSNVQFGEGGAGTFSDGKLNTLVKDRDGRGLAVLEAFVKFGAKESICYEAKPHIGTDVLCGVVRRMREEIIRLGGQVRFGSQVTDIELEQEQVTGVVVNGRERIACGQLVLAIGHSARDTLAMLHRKQVPMEAKAFAVGLRVEHPQSAINESQYGIREPGALGAAPYKVAAKAKNGRGVYSFCMCPGGYVVNASSEEGHTAVNGMSYSGRDGKNANSAVIVTVTPEDFGSDGPLAGIAFQRCLEQRAYEIGQGKVPVQRYGDFRRQVAGICPDPAGAMEEGIGEAPLLPQCKGQYQWADVSKILPAACNTAIVEGMEAFAAQIKGFNRPDACLSGVESRTSSPVRILRDGCMQSRARGLYPCGEGAGYAGGILSAAMDGIRVAEQIAAAFKPPQEPIRRHCARNADGTVLEYLSFPLLEGTGIARHLFSTRIGGASKGIYASMNLSFTRGDREEDVLENHKRIAGILGCSINHMVASHQTHTTNIRRVTGADRGKGIVRDRDYEDVDGLITDEPGIALVTYYADCVPLYFVDPVHRAIGLAHSGWRGTAGKMGARMVQAMQEAFGSRPEELRAAIGPSICQGCYEVSQDVAQQFAGMGAPVVLPGKSPGKYQLNLWLANEKILELAGIPRQQIAVANLCTCHNSAYLFSHRASGGKRGNLGAFLMLEPQVPHLCPSADA